MMVSVSSISPRSIETSNFPDPRTGLLRTVGFGLVLLGPLSLSGLRVPVAGLVCGIRGLKREADLSMQLPFAQI